MSGTQLKLRGIEKVKRHNRQWIADTASFVQELIDTGMEFTNDDVRQDCRIAEPTHPNAYGAVFSVLAKQGKIQRVGHRPSVLPSTHGRIVSVWKGVQ